MRLTIEVSARLHRELIAYTIALNGNDIKNAPLPERLVPVMVARFIATDRSFGKNRREVPATARPTD